MGAAERDRLAEALAGVLAQRPGLDKRGLRRALVAAGWTSVDTSEINSVLYETGRPFRWNGTSAHRLWRVEGAGTATATAPAQRRPSRAKWSIPRSYAGHPLRVWQVEALQRWTALDSRGVVEAVTGTGKTAVGVAAAAFALDRGLRVAVVVPTRDLLDQWHAVLTRDIPTARAGRLGDGWSDSLSSHRLLVATVQSASRQPLLPTGFAGLIVADEVHRYGADGFSKALEVGYTERLGLTATYERDDDGKQRHLVPYFRSVVGGCDYRRGLAEGILAPFRVAMLGVEFTPGERIAYDQLDADARRTRRTLIEDFGCPEEPFGEFMRCAVALGQGEGDPTGVWVARKYLTAFSQRRQLLADCGRKQTAVAALSGVLARSGRSLVFSETVDSAQKAADELRGQGLKAYDYTSDLDREARKRRLDAFRTGQAKVLCAPRVLDEGVDVPEADVGVILAASRSKRQMIQRMGRVIRPKGDGRAALFFVVYVTGTSEDPARGAHGVFLEEMTHVAREVRDFRGLPPASELLTWASGS